MTKTPAIPRHERQARDTTFDDVAVAPRYLAGSGSIGDDAFVPLTYYYWHDMHDEMGNFYVTTMDSQLRVAFVPEASELIPNATALWQIHARRDFDEPPQWSAAFTDHTPPEIIAGLTAALDTDVTADRHRQYGAWNSADHPDAVWSVLQEAGWTVKPAEGFSVEAVSPGGLARLTYRALRRGVPTSEAWRATVVATPEARRSLWEADFHAATPPRLVAAFAEALANPAPLTRERDMVPQPCRDRARSLHPPQQRATRTPGPTPLDVRRVHAARASTAAVPTSTVRWTSPSPPSTPPRPGSRARR